MPPPPPPPTPRRDRKTTSINSPSSSKSCEEEEEVSENAAETTAQEKVATIVSAKRERSPSPPLISKIVKTEKRSKEGCGSPIDGTTKEAAETRKATEAPSPGSSKDGDSDLGSSGRNRSLEALFKVTDSELQSITSKVKSPIVATETLTSIPGSAQEVNISVETSAANTVVETVEAIGTAPPSGEVEMVQIVTVVPEDMIAYQYLNADNANQKLQLKSDSSEDVGYKIVYVNQDSRQMEQNIHLPYPAQTVYQDLQILQNSGQSSSSPSTSSAATPTQETARKRKYSAQKPGRHICPYCNRGCAKPSVLEKHIRAHTNERPYPCVPCGFSFKTKSNLYKHCKSRAHAIKIGHSAASIDEMDLNKSTDKDDLGEGSDISESELDGDDGSTPIEMVPPTRRLDSQGQSTDSDCAAALSAVGLYTGRASLESEAPSAKHDDAVIITDVEDQTASSNWRPQRPNSGQITKSHSFTMHPGEGERVLFSSRSFDSSAAAISQAEKQSKFLLRSASEPSKSMTPEMLNQRISALISANDAVLSTPMAEPPRPKRLSRQNSESKEYTQPRLLLQQAYQQQPAGNVVMVSSSQLQTEGVRIMPKPQVMSPVPQEQYYIIGDQSLQHVGISSQMQVPRLELATPVEMEGQRPQEIKIQIQLPKPESRAPTHEGITSLSRSSSVIKDLLLRSQSPSEVAIVPQENQPNIRRMRSAPQMSQPKIDHIIVEEIEGGHLVIADAVEVDLADQSHGNTPYLAGDPSDPRGHVSRAQSLEISASAIPHFGRLHASSSLSLSSIPGALQRSASLGHHPSGSIGSLSQPNLAQMTSFQIQASAETPSQSHASSQSLQKLRGKILMRRSMSAERALEDESVVKPDTPKISQSKQVTTPQKRKEAYKSTSLGRSSLTSSLKQTSVERQPSVEKQVSFDIDGGEKQRERRSKTGTKDDYKKLNIFTRTQSEPAMGSPHSGEQILDELAMPLAVAIQPELHSDLVDQSLLGLLPMPPREDDVRTGQKIISVSLPGSSQQAFILPVNQSFQFFRQPRLAIAPLRLGRICGQQMISTSPISSIKLVSSPNESTKMSPVTEPGKRVMRVLSDIKSPSIHNLPPEKAMSLLLLGHNYPSLRMSSNLSFCSLQGTQPMYVPIGSSNKLSMYSNWKTASHNPNPMGLSSKALFSLYRTRKRSSPEYFVTAPTQVGNTGVLTHSSAWNFFNSARTPAHRNMTAPIISSKISPSKVKPDVVTSPQRAKDDSNILMTKMTKFIKLPQVTKQASLDENALRRNSENRELKRSLSEMVTPKRVKIFKGGWKSEEEYIYVRGRGRGKYVCEECGIRCKKPSMLKKHIRTHTDVRPYVCKHCSFSFKTKGNLTKHMKSKSHQRKCVELGVLPVPICIDDSQIDLEALARQARLTKAQKDLEDEAGMNSDDDDGDDDDDDDGDDGEDVEMDDEEETRESAKVLSSLEMAEPDHEEEVVTVETPEKTRANAAPAYVAIRGEQGNQPTFAKVILDGEKISEQRLGTIYGYQTKHGTDKGDDTGRRTIDDEIARSLLDLSKGAEQCPGGDDSQDSQGEKQGERLGSLIGALIDRTTMTKGDSPVKVIIQQEGGEQVVIERTASPVAAGGNEVNRTDDASKGLAAAAASPSSVQFIFTPDSTSKSGAGTIRITHSGFVPPICFSREAAKEMLAKHSGPTEKVAGSGADAVLHQTLDKEEQRIPTGVDSAKAICRPTSGAQAVNSGPIIGQMVRPVLLVPNASATTGAVPVISPTITTPRLSPQSQASNPFRDKRKAESFEQVSPPKRQRTLSPFSYCSERPVLGGKRPGLVRQISVDIADDSMPGSSTGSDTSPLMDAGPSGLRQSPSSSGVPVPSVYSHSGLSAPATSVLVRQLSAPLPQVTQNPLSQVVPEKIMRVIHSPSPLTVTTTAIQLVSPQSQIVQVLPPGGLTGSPGTSVQSPQVILPHGTKPISIAELTGKSGYIQLLSSPSGQITLLPAQSYFENLSTTSPVLVQSMPVIGEQVPREDAARSLAEKECKSRSRTWHGESCSIEEAMDAGDQRSRSPSRSSSPSRSRSPLGARSPSGSRSPGIDEEAKSIGQKVSKLASSQSLHQHDVTYVTGENSAPFEIKPIPGRVNDEKEAFVDGKYVCTTCGKLFTEHHQLTLHKNIHYIERQYRCEDCNISFRTPILLQKHRRSESHHAKLSVNQQFGIPTTDNPRPYRCDDCEVAFRIHGHLAKHLRSKAHIAMLERMGKVPHGTSSRIEHSESDGSLESDPSLDSLRQMIDKANSATLFQNMEGRSSASPSGAPFLAMQSYSSESESGEPVFTRSPNHPPVPMIVIDHVDEDDPSVPACGIPEIMITPATPLACNIPTSSPPPESSDTDPSSLRSSEYETDVHASNDRVTVEIKQELIDLSEVGGRQQVLEPQSKRMPLTITFQCSQCGAKMTDKSVFESHMISHQTSKTLPLKEGKLTSVAGGGVECCKGGVPLPDGDAVVRDGGAQKCGICAKRFASIGTLKQHLASHAELRPYVCEYCDAGFTTGQSLRIHLGTHKQERPYVCGNCGLTFAQSDDLNTHHSTEHGPLEEDGKAKSQDGGTS